MLISKISIKAKNPLYPLYFPVLTQTQTLLHLFLVNLFLYLENKFLKDLYTNGVNVFH